MQPFVIPVKGLKTGENAYNWHLDSEFFSAFENSEIHGADLEVEAAVIFDGIDIEVRCSINGSVIVTCDRCLEDVELPVETSFECDEYEGMTELDLGQDIYDYVCISLPMTRVHADGECNEETIKYLSK